MKPAYPPDPPVSALSGGCFPDMLMRGSWKADAALPLNEGLWGTPPGAPPPAVPDCDTLAAAAPIAHTGGRLRMDGESGRPVGRPPGPVGTRPAPDIRGAALGESGGTAARPAGAQPDKDVDREDDMVRGEWSCSCGTKKGKPSRLAMCTGP